MIADAYRAQATIMMMMSVEEFDPKVSNKEKGRSMEEAKGEELVDVVAANHFAGSNHYRQ